MAFYAGRIVLEPAMANPTLVVLTDRNDLDDQLFGTFARCHDLLRQEPVQAQDRADLRAKLAVGSGGVVFTTIQKFLPDERGDTHPVLSDRRNIVVIADEAHRSQYDFIDGFARHLRDALPGASFIGFTGTPIELDRRQHPLGVRRLHQRLRHRALGPRRRDRPDLLREPAREARARRGRAPAGSTPPSRRSPRARRSTARSSSRAAGRSSRRSSAPSTGSRLVAADLVAHFEDRLATMDGKAMVVTMSRRIAVDLYREIAALRPEWVGTGDDDGALKVVMTGSASDPLDWQDHIRNKPRREALAARFRDPADPFRVVIVRDMWLTGFDAPVPAHDVPRQADARARPDAGDRAGQPGVPRQAGRPRRGLPRARRRAAQGARDVHGVAAGPARPRSTRPRRSR